MNTTSVYSLVATVEPKGHVSAANASEFQAQLTTAVKSQKHSILLVDMKEVDFLDSAGLMALIKGFRLAQSLGRKLIICSVAPSVRIVFELTQLDKVFEIFDDRYTFETTFNKPLAA